MAYLNDEIINAVQRTPGLTDRELADVLRGRAAPQQPINQAARVLEGKGLLVRKRGPDNLIRNYPSGGDVVQAAQNTFKAVSNHDVDALSEDEIKKVLNE